MKTFWLGFYKSFLLVIFFLVFSNAWTWSLRVIPNHDTLLSLQEKAAIRQKEEGGKEAGSSLPDCSHACGACFPCKRVIVSFKCFTVESCPIVYKCMCKGKYYHLPSN